MIKYKAIALLAAISFASARPSEDKAPLNMVTVPTNCPEGQQLVNGVCRDIWRLYQNAEAPEQYIKDNVPLNMITVPQNCPPGQELINGVCRDVWRFLPTSPMPPMAKNMEQDIKDNMPLNMITVPQNCPPGQELVNGVCRDIWRFLPTSPIPPMAKNAVDNFLGELIERFQSIINQREKRQVEAEEMLALLDKANTDRNIISVPNQCPAGYKPDILGICRPIFN